MRGLWLGMSILSVEDFGFMIPPLGLYVLERFLEDSWT